MKKIIIAILLVGGVGAAIALYLFQKPVASLESATPTATFTASALFDVFESNEVSAAEAYSGKVIEVSGTLAEIMKNEDGSTTLVLSSEHPIYGVKCRLDPDFKLLNIPEEGSTVKLKGLCTGYNADVELNQSIIL
jgi:hypothetical protein